MASNIIQQIKNEYSMLAVIDKFNITELNLDSSNKGACPVCANEKAFKVYDNNFKCFRCGEHGDVLNLLVLTKRASSLDSAINLLSNKEVPTFKKYKRRASALSEVYKVYEQHAKENKEVIFEYIGKRGWDKILYNKIGLATPSLKIEHKGITTRHLKDCELLTNYGKDYYDNHIIFPVYNKYRSLVHLCGRALDDREVRWKSTKGEPSITKHFYNSDQLFFNSDSSNYLIICEGISDGVSLEQLGVPYISQFGIHVKLETYKEDFAKFDYLIFCYDRDKYPLGNDKVGEYKSWGPMLPKIIDLAISFKKPIYFLMTPNKPGIKDLNDWLLSIDYDFKEYAKYGRSNCTPIEELALEIYGDNLSNHKHIWRLLAANCSGDSELIAKRFLAQQKPQEQYLLDLFSQNI